MYPSKREARDLTQIHKNRDRSCKDGGKDWSDMTTSKGIMAALEDGRCKRQTLLGAL